MPEPRLCSVPGCNKNHYAKELCQAHYMKWRKYGNPLAEVRQGRKMTSRSDVPLDEVNENLAAQARLRYNEEKFGEVKDWVFIRELNRLLNLKNFELVSDAVAKTCFGRGVLELIQDGAIKDYRNICFINGDAPADYFNVWRIPESLKPDTTTPGPLDGMTKVLLENLGGEHKDYLINWLAYGIQNPGELTCALILHGVQGSGKSTLASLLQAAYGDLFDTVNLNAIQSEFNPWLERKLLIVAEEITVSGFRDRERVANMMKTWVVGGRVIINRKNVPQYTIDNLSRWLIFSNDKYPMPIDADDRRYSVIKQTQKLDPDLGAAIFMDRKKLAQNLVDYLSDVNIPANFIPMRPLENDDRKKVQEIGRSKEAVVQLR